MTICPPRMTRLTSTDGTQRTDSPLAYTPAGCGADAEPAAGPGLPSRLPALARAAGHRAHPHSDAAYDARNGITVMSPRSMGSPKTRRAWSASPPSR